MSKRAIRCADTLLPTGWPGAVDALVRLGEIVHDIDLKDGRFGAPEAAGFARVIEGICARIALDSERIQHGSALLDDLYAGIAEAAAMAPPGQ